MTDIASLKLAADGTLQPMTQAEVAQQAADAAAQTSSSSPREQVGAVLLRAVVDLGWWDFFDAGAARQATPTAQGGAGKPYDQRAWATIGKTDRVIVADAPLNRVAKAAEAARVAASGQPAPAAPVITMAAVMDHGDAMLAAGS